MNDKDKFTLWIDAVSLDKYIDAGGIMIEEKDYPGFVSALNDAKAKYEEWTKTAKDNEVDDFRKDIKVKSKVSAYFKSLDEWHFQYYVNLKFSFLVRKDSDGVIAYLLLVQTGELNSSKSSITDCDGFVFSFMNAGEVDEFLSEISMEAIDSFKSKPSKDDLFKD